jgi:hypothetical protein
MKTKIILLLILSSLVSLKSEQATNEVELLKQQLLKLQQDFEEIQRQQVQQIQLLKERIDGLEKAKNVQIEKPKPSSDIDWKKEVITPKTQSNEKWTPTSPIRLAGSGNNYLDLSLDAL